MDACEQLRMALTYAEAWGAASRVLAFERTVEILVRAKGTDDLDLRARALATLERIRRGVPRSTRCKAAQLAADGWPDVSMLWLFRHEPVEDVAPLFRNGRLTEAQLQRLRPELPDGLRTLLRQDSADEPGASFSAEPAPAGMTRTIPSALLRSVEAELVSLAGDWRWECCAAGKVHWLDGPAPAGLKDLSLLQLEGADSLWPAFQRRGPFRGCEVRIERRRWRLAGVPFFGRSDGRFLGYRGVAERCDSVSAAGLLGWGSSGDDLATMTHEVRSPLNAIMGFAQLIRAEARGPAPAGLRDSAGAVLHNAERLLATIDDLADIARLSREKPDAQPLDTAALIERVTASHRVSAEERGAALAATLAPDLPALAGDERAVERALNRLVATVLSVSQAGETLLLGAQGSVNGVQLFLTRPSTLDGQTAEQLLGAAAAIPQVGGFGFSLRIVARLAEAVSGAFAIEPHRFTLALPAAANAEQAVAKQDWSA